MTTQYYFIGEAKLLFLIWVSSTFGKVNINKLESQVGLGSEATHDLRVSGGLSLFLFSPPNNSQCTNYNILGETQQYQATITSAQQWLLSISLLNKDILILRKKKLFSTIHANTKYKHWKIDFNSLVLCSQQENNEL